MNASSPTSADLTQQFEASLPLMVERGRRIKLQPIIANHWFSAAASECFQIHINGYFYGSLSVGMAYIEAITKFFYEKNALRINGMNVADRWKQLNTLSIVPPAVAQQACCVFSDRNDFLHLNKCVEIDRKKLEKKSEDMINTIYEVERFIFEHSFSSGKLIPKYPKYWETKADQRVEIFIRSW